MDYCTQPHNPHKSLLENSPPAVPPANSNASARAREGCRDTEGYNKLYCSEDGFVAPSGILLSPHVSQEVSDAQPLPLLSPISTLARFRHHRTTTKTNSSYFLPFLYWNTCSETVGSRVISRTYIGKSTLHKYMCIPREVVRLPTEACGCPLPGVLKVRLDGSLGPDLVGGNPVHGNGDGTG